MLAVGDWFWVNIMHGVRMNLNLSIKFVKSKIAQPILVDEECFQASKLAVKLNVGVMTCLLDELYFISDFKSAKQSAENYCWIL